MIVCSLIRHCSKVLLQSRISFLYSYCFEKGFSCIASAGDIYWRISAKTRSEFWITAFAFFYNGLPFVVVCLCLWDLLLTFTYEWMLTAYTHHIIPVNTPSRDPFEGTAATWDIYYYYYNPLHFVFYRSLFFFLSLLVFSSCILPFFPFCFSLSFFLSSILIKE